MTPSPPDRPRDDGPTNDDGEPVPVPDEGDEGYAAADEGHDDDRDEGDVDRRDEADEAGSERVRPEVVRPAGKGFFAKMAAAQANAESARQASGRPSGRPAGRMVRFGCIALMVTGVLTSFLYGGQAADPEGGRCRTAEIILADETDLTSDAVGELECADVVAQVQALEDGPDLPSEGAIRTTGLVLAGVGLAQIAAGLLLSRNHNPRLRLFALVVTGLGIIASPLGLVSLALTLFTAYAIGFSADSRAVFGVGRGFGRARMQPRQPPPDPAA